MIHKTITLIFLTSFFHQVLFAQLDFNPSNASSYPQLSRLDSMVQSGKYERITSILVAREGKLIFEKYYNGAQQSTKHNTRSVTKTLATLLTGIAIKQGYIQSEKDKIFSYLKHKLPVKNPDKRKEEITIEDLLTMSSLFECDDFNQFSRGHEERMYIIEDWTQFLLDLPIRAFPFSPKPEDSPYGRSFSYCSAGAACMAEILQSAIGSDLDKFADKNLFQPLGIEDYTMHYNPEGIMNTAGGSEYQSRDFLKLAQLCLNNGQWDGQQIIPKAWLQKASSPQAVPWDGFEYGYLFWISSFGKEKKFKAFFMSGNGGNKVLAMPELGLAVVITSKNYNNRNAHNYAEEILNEYIVPAMLD